MAEHERLTGRSQQPTPAVVADFVGGDNAARWSDLLCFIEETYPGVFQGEWLYSGAKHGWGLRFKKSGSFCTLIPERDSMRVLIVFGAAERQKVEAVLPTLASRARDDYLAATTYHDGKWVLLDVDGDDVLNDVKQLLLVKRRPAVKKSGGEH